MSTAPEPEVPAFVRGDVRWDALTRFGGRDGVAAFHSPDPAALADRLPLRDPTSLRELHHLRTEEIIDYLVDLGDRLRLEGNEHLTRAAEHAAELSDLPVDLVRSSYRLLPDQFTQPALREVAEAIGTDHLDGWPVSRMADGRLAAVHAFGARSVHIIAGNSPTIAAMTIIRNAITRGDAIIKTPSNDPLTAVAIARTMADMAPDHPLTRHLCVAYWKGGDETVEQRLYQPELVEKIVAWGGMASVQHVTRYLRPGLELITFDPKRSATILGRDTFASESVLDDVAYRVALDIGAFNQIGCVNSRVVYVESGTDQAGLDRATDFGRRIYQHLLKLPDYISTPARRFDPELRAMLRALRAATEWYEVIGGRDDEGAVIVSQLDEPVGFHPALSGRIANIVPVDNPQRAIEYVDASTQTVGVYPPSLQRRLRDLLPLSGVQRLVEVGYAVSVHPALPQDAFEPIRRLVRWVVDETVPSRNATDPDPRLRQPLDLVYPPHRDTRRVP